MTKKVTEMSPDEIKGAVRDAYAGVAKRNTREACGASGCDSQAQASSCCGPSLNEVQMSRIKEHGYKVQGLPSSMTESYAGCGNPIALASMAEGETVLDLGSGAGLDAFFAAQKVGPTGKVIGVDMTPEMLAKARNNARKMGVTNVEFRAGDIEALPVDNETVDVIISNCVINLAPNKAKVFEEAYRVLKPGGRLMVSDIVLNGQLTDEVRNDIANYTGCLGGAIPEDEYLQLMRDAGFQDVRVVEKAGGEMASSARIAGKKVT